MQRIDCVGALRHPRAMDRGRSHRSSGPFLRCCPRLAQVGPCAGRCAGHRIALRAGDRLAHRLSHRIAHRICRFVSLLILWIVPLTAQAKSYNLFGLLSEADVDAELSARWAESTSFPELIDRTTRGLIGAPYILSPLGEGSGGDVDADPRFRLDAFDCTTFVETALALTHCRDLPSAKTFLDQIRYVGDKAVFADRRHFMTSQWIPGLIAAGLMEDVTEDVGGPDTEKIALVLTPQRWKKRRVARSIALPPERIPRGTFHLPFVPIASVLTHLRRVPPGTIVNVVRADAPSTFDVITHQGLIIVLHDGTRVVRHASPVSKRVIDEPLEHMARRYLRPRKWPIVGMNFLQVRPGECALGDRRGVDGATQTVQKSGNGEDTTASDQGRDDTVRAFDRARRHASGREGAHAIPHDPASPGREGRPSRRRSEPR